MDPVILRTERLELSAPRAADGNAITAACQDPAIARWTTVPSPYTRDHADAFIRLTAGWWAEDAEYTWAIRRRRARAAATGANGRAGGDAEPSTTLESAPGRADVGDLFGVISLRRTSRRDGALGDAEIGFWMSSAARGKGYLTEAATAVLDFGFAPEGCALGRVEWRAIVGNEASAGVARALGFRYEGRLRQAIISSRGREDTWVAGLLAGDDRAAQPWPDLAGG